MGSASKLDKEAEETRAQELLSASIKINTIMSQFSIRNSR